MGRKIKCGKCNEVKDVRHFYKNSSRKEKTNTVCKECQKKYEIEKKDKSK